MSKKKSYPLLENISILDIADKGNTFAKYNELALFINGGVPGDIVDVQVTKKKKSFMEGRIVKTHSLSPIRTATVCEHFGVCGGCKWQHMSYSEQLKFKQRQVEDQLRRIGKLDLPEVPSILASPETLFYRNKLEFTFSHLRWLDAKDMGKEDIEEKRGLGFHVPGRFDKVVDVNKCWLQPDPSNAIRNSIRDFAFKNDYTFFNIRDHAGLLRTLIIRDTMQSELMVIVTFYENDEAKIKALLEHLRNTFPQITSLMYAVNRKGNDSIYDQDVQLFHGKDHIIEDFEGTKFKIGPKSFFQTNSQQALELYRITRDFASIGKDDVVYDLYTGTGTIANFVAHQAKKVVGVEYVPEAIEDAKVNSAFNNIGNTIFFAGDMKDVLTSSFINEHGKPDVLITDPPRAGMHEDVVKRILEAEPRVVVYVSCNAATQARDLDLMRHKYKVTKVQPVDMFPHTHHTESVVKLELTV
ncbi:MAG: 23S rRNA (uracil(1939)-C(5))-methyltransferase RlmD [Flavobacteriales bacterium]